MLSETVIVSIVTWFFSSSFLDIEINRIYITFFSFLFDEQKWRFKFIASSLYE